MSPAKFSDRQLDTLLALVEAPLPPASDLAQRIVARATATQAARPVYSPPPRHRPRRHRVAWSAFLGANVLAAAAAASSWDGQRFDFHRLTDLPHRVALAIHLPRRDKHHELALRERTRPSAPLVPNRQSASITSPSKQIVPGPVTHQISIPIRVPDYPPKPPRLALRSNSSIAARPALREVRQDHLASMHLRSYREASHAHRVFERQRPLNEMSRVEGNSVQQERSLEIAPPAQREERQAESLSKPATTATPAQTFDVAKESKWRGRGQAFGRRMPDRPFASPEQKPNWMGRIHQKHRGFRRLGRRF